MSVVCATRKEDLPKLSKAIRSDLIGRSCIGALWTLLKSMIVFLCRCERRILQTFGRRFVSVRGLLLDSPSEISLSSVQSTSFEQSGVISQVADLVSDSVADFLFVFMSFIRLIVQEMFSHFRNRFQLHFRFSPHVREIAKRFSLSSKNIFNFVSVFLWWPVQCFGFWSFAGRVGSRQRKLKQQWDWFCGRSSGWLPRALFF